eukprot:Tbor_TRINITY_DN5231_c2_g5::TRINITY_DN5231_c2_g5_i1::g.16521::m.16521
MFAPIRKILFCTAGGFFIAESQLYSYNLISQEKPQQKPKTSWFNIFNSNNNNNNYNNNYNNYNNIIKDDIINFSINYPTASFIISLFIIFGGGSFAIMGAGAAVICESDNGLRNYIEIKEKILDYYYDNINNISDYYDDDRGN